MISGVIVPLPTPFDVSGNLDKKSFSEHVNRVKSADCVLVAGSTGEGRLLSNKEINLSMLMCKEVKQSLKLMVCLGGFSASDIEKIAIESEAKDIADSFLIAPPPYVLPSEDGLLRYYEVLSNFFKEKPICAYDIPKRTGVSLSDDLLVKIEKHSSVCSLKDCGKFSGRAMRLKSLGSKINVLAGDDVNFMNEPSGSTGCFSVIANLFPDEVISTYHLLLKGQNEKLDIKETPLYQLSVKFGNMPNPATIKRMLFNLTDKSFSEELREPLMKPSGEMVRSIDEALLEFSKRNHFVSV